MSDMAWYVSRSSGVHVFFTYRDKMADIGLMEIFVPMTADGWEWGITWGALAMYIFAAVVFTSWPKKRLSRRNWLMVHLISIPATLMAATHAWMVGSSTNGLWFQALLALMAGLAVYPAVLRLASVLAKRNQKQTKTKQSSPRQRVGAS